jgi:DNA-binding transcriptional regulator GbsR (MarR family)
MEPTVDEIIEKWGVYYKRTGHQPMMGRLMAYLMVVDPPHQTFEEITSSLRSSKSSVSNTLTLMTQLGLVDYVRFPGNRKRYFRLNPNVWNRFFDSTLKEIRGFKGLISEVMSARTDKHPAMTREIYNLVKLLDVFETELPNLLEKWKQQIRN